MQIRFNEHGRSMVEMLGVLAVIGVLSVSGILGYKFAMNKYIANETINELNIRASAISHHMEQYIENNYAGDIPMEMGPVMRMGYPITARMHPQYVDYFEMFVSEVPSEICKLLLQSQWQAPYSIFIGTTQYESSVDICTQAEKVELAYEFHKDLLPEAEIEEKDRHEIMRCRHSNDCNCGTCNVQIGLCETNCLDNEKCVKDYSEPEWMICCRKSNIVGSYCCASVTEDGKCCDWDGNCCPADKPLRGTDGKCYSCDDKAKVDVKNMKKNCNVCPNRFVQGNVCVSKCDKDYFMDKDGNCRSCKSTTAYSVHGVENYCDACPNRFVDNANPGNYCYLKCDSAENGTAGKPLNEEYGTCYSCDTTTSINVNGTNKERCSKICPNRVLSGSMCQLGCSDPDTPLLIDGSGTCKACNYPGRVAISALTDSCSKLCSNREEKNGYCVLKECEKGYFMDKNGSCHDCYTKSAQPVQGVESNCDACPNRFVDNANPGNYCYLKCDSEENGTKGLKLNEEYGTCYSCETATSVNVNGTNKERCSKICPNRVLSGSMCQLGCSDPDTPLLIDGSGTCKACNYPERVAISALTDSCSKLCPNREEKNGYCVLKACEKGYFMDKNGSCHDCYTKSAQPVHGVESNCDACPNRFVDNANPGNYCYLKCDSEENGTAGKPLNEEYGTCYSCETATSVNVNGNNKGRCTKICPNRVLNGTMCNREKCSDDKQLLGADKECYECNITTPIKVTDKKDCDVCVNRSYKDGYCYPPSGS